MAPLNRLSEEASPYLLQHAANPVDWWPWSEEAFAEARRRDVPMFISIGYSACHWCHVMAHESFEDADVARVLDDGFVAVKVDREERPDVDAVYMEATQLQNGTGGWPMTVLALADGRPFWAGTYLRKPDLLSLLRRVSELWGSRREAIRDDAARLAESLRRATGPTTGAAGAGAAGLAPGALSLVVEALLARYDPQWGGSAGAPKFPQPASLEVLARSWWRTGHTDALAALRRTLDAMSSGGIYDHLAGGFARYSTDRRWLVPHFEKMLYDNALLARTYACAWQLTGDERYRQVVDETVGYLLSPPLRLPEGAWASAEDADSEGEEGRFYTWSLAEIEEVAGKAAAEWYGASSAGNWEGKNILWRPDLGTIARTPEIEQARRRLLERRSARPRPGLDTKVITEWNAMAIAALAYAGAALAMPAWVSAAEATARMLLGHLRRSDGRWMRSWSPPHRGTDGPDLAAGWAPGQGLSADAQGSAQGGVQNPASASLQAGALVGAKHLAYAGDYAWLVEAFTRLGEATGSRSWATMARETADDLIELFWDKQNGAFFTYGTDGEELIVRMKDLYDGALPSANATAALALARLGELTGDRSYSEIAERTVSVMAPALHRAPIAFPSVALAMDYLSEPRRQVVVASHDPTFVRPAWERYLPDTVLAWGEPYGSVLWDGRDGAANAGTAFVCQGYRCELPVHGPAELARLLDKRAP